MADHGQVINSRMYWTYTGPDGKLAVSDTPPIGPSTPFGIGATAPASTQYHEQTYEDGTKVVSRWDATVGEHGDWKQESVEVDRGIQAQYNAAQKPEAAAKAPAYRTFPDGSLRVEDPAAPEGWRIVATKPQGPTVPAAPELVTLPDGSKAQWNPAKGDWDVKFTKPAPKDELPEITVPARRPGQTTDLATVKSEADTYLANLNAQVAAGTLTRAERSRLWDSYYQTTVKPRLEDANREANAEAARLAQRTERTEATRSRESELDFSQQAGRNAVADALALLPYQVSPTFLREFAAGLGTLSSGGGHVAFSPEAFQIQLPDLNALAEQGAQRAAAMYQRTAGVPFTPSGAVSGAPAPAAPSQGGPAMTVGQSLAAAPFQPRPMPGAMPPQIQAGSVGGEPTQEELARRLAQGYGP